ncbi:MAG: asparaginase [Legionellaceae bacterium]|nr:asparaginase [Legionellaceae bacterium]
MKKKVLIINTGGTISSVKKPHGYEPAEGYVAKVLLDHPVLQHTEMPAYTILEYQPLLDSSNITLIEWNRIAADIVQHYTEFDGFVILHGTDTMAYTATALSFMFEHLGKPVILTGSQIPLSEVHNDAMNNIIMALLLAQSDDIHEVCIYFNHTLLRGNRTQKVSVGGFSAFDSPNFPPLGRIGFEVCLDRTLLLSAPKKPLHWSKMQSQRMANFRLFPGYSQEVLAAILAQPLDVFILETYGAGNAPSQDKAFLQVLEKAHQKGVLLVNVTQCRIGSVAMSHYATGYALQEMGFISAYDMTMEAVYGKLLYLLSKGNTAAQIRDAMRHSLRGEVTPT